LKKHPGWIAGIHDVPIFSSFSPVSRMIFPQFCHFSLVFGKWLVFQIRFPLIFGSALFPQAISISPVS